MIIKGRTHHSFGVINMFTIDNGNNAITITSTGARVAINNPSQINTGYTIAENVKDFNTRIQEELKRGVGYNKSDDDIYFSKSLDNDKHLDIKELFTVPDPVV